MTAVCRALGKFAAGLFEPCRSNRILLKPSRAQGPPGVGQGGSKSLVLLKNGKNKPMLPLSRKAPRILVAGTHAHDVGYQCGGWTVSRQGGRGNTTTGMTILEGIKEAVSQRTEVVYEKRPNEAFFRNAKNFSYAIVVVGELPYAETDGDNLNLVLPLGSDKIIEDDCSRIRCLVILISGRPLVMERYLDSIDPLAASWLPGGEAGPGIADVIFGKYDFQGKLLRTWFRRVDQPPMNVGDPHYDPLFPFGFGLRMNTRSRHPSPKGISSSSASSSSSSFPHEQSSSSLKSKNLFPYSLSSSLEDLPVGPVILPLHRKRKRTYNAFSNQPSLTQSD